MCGLCLGRIITILNINLLHLIFRNIIILHLIFRNIITPSIILLDIITFNIINFLLNIICNS
jgi:hypothetical protein